MHICLGMSVFCANSRHWLRRIYEARRRLSKAQHKPESSRSCDFIGTKKQRTAQRDLSGSVDHDLQLAATASPPNYEAEIAAMGRVFVAHEIGYVPRARFRSFISRTGTCCRRSLVAICMTPNGAPPAPPTLAECWRNV